jgi:Zinc carboxypeptidase
MHMVGVLLGSVCAVLMCLAGSSALAQENEADDLRAKLAAMPRPWDEKIHRITQDEYEGTLRYWAETHPDKVTVEQLCEPTPGFGVHLLRITDSAVPDTDKQVCMVASLHGGPERTGPTTALHLIEWLLSDDPDAVKTRRNQIVLVMPVVNPKAFFVTDRFGNAHGIDPYTGGGVGKWDLNTLTHKEIEKAPEIAAVLDLFDLYQPEVFADLHGVGLQEFAEDTLGDRTMVKGHTMFEITGSAYSNFALRPWDWRVTEAMVAAGQEWGAGSDRFEADAQRAFAGPATNAIADRLWLGRANFYTAQIAYAKYHTMIMALEIGWEGSGVARMKGLLNIGNSNWQDESVRGYPVDRVAAFCGHFVSAYGTTAEARRRSRVELWQRQGGFGQGMLYPQIDGRDTYICATTPEACALLDADPKTFLDNCAGLPGFDVEAVRAFVEAGPEVKLVVSVPKPKEGEAPALIANGLALRLRIPYRSPELVDLRLNGRLLEESAIDGYQSWFGNGFTQVQVNVPPDKASASGLWVVTCAYTPEVRREYGWTPPKAVTEGLKGASNE